MCCYCPRSRLKLGQFHPARVVRASVTACLAAVCGTYILVERIGLGPACLSARPVVGATHLELVALETALCLA